MAPFSVRVDQPGRRAPWRSGELGAILLTSLLKFVVIVGLLGVVAYDGLSIAHGQVTLRDDAQQASQLAHDAVSAHQSASQAYAIALHYAKAHGATIPRGGFEVGADGSVSVTLTRSAPTLVAGRISAFDTYVTPRVTVVARNSTF